ncbi:RidA family protein [Streptomonospora litoralis]|uniref:Endoribonuclease L-PSP n=1 Tax=Streptomonospora litoralis TaxID=2498135 RepID=A0A4P6Q4Y7_9ACTN|nr:RidA family protein [Streptomonospora litoralis]QBI55663.1 Endoribonuclease L-PSP [Streptomonospora litoralis]
MVQRYSDAVAANGLLADGDSALRARQVSRDIDAALARHGADSRHPVEAAYYLRRMADSGALRRATGGHPVHEPRPASTLVEVSGLVAPRFPIEVAATARLPRGHGPAESE